MKILITNDDGINSPALPYLANWAANIGEVTVVSPKVEQSGKSHGIEIHRQMEIKKVDLNCNCEAYYVDSTPADCVRFAFIGLKKEFDIVISGINKGYNLGKDIVYSGTIGAVFEAENFGAKCIAISTAPESFDEAISKLDDIYKFFVDNKLFEINKIYNINIPLDSKGIKITKQGGAYFSDDFVLSEDSFYLQAGKCVYSPADMALNLDTDATMNGFISVTPLSNERTNFGVYDKLVNLNADKL